MRRRCPVAFSDYLQWSLFRHADVRRVLEDHATFSNAASRHLSVPNAMDPPEHSRFRRLIEPYFGPEPMADFAPTCRAIAEALVDRLPAAIDEILRLDASLMSNRRLTTRPAEIGGRRLAAGERLTILWGSTNRDEAVFGDPDEVRLDRDPADNLLYGAGIHVCPGAPLARMELRHFLEALLETTRELSLVPDRPPVRARYPAGGYARMPIWVSRRTS